MPKRQLTEAELVELRPLLLALLAAAQKALEREAKGGGDEQAS